MTSSVVREQAADLERRFGRPPALRFCESPLGGPVAEIAGPFGRAMIAIRGAQVLDWTPAGQEPVFWLSPLARLDSAKPARGGVPVCWPWFGPADRPGAPAHGFARTAEWQVVESRVDQDAAQLVLEFEATPDRYPDWVGDARARLTVSVGQSLQIELATFNRGAAPVRITQALHAYLRFFDICTAEVRGLDGCSYEDQCDGHRRVTQSGVVAIRGEVDRLYADRGPPTSIADHGAGRRILIAKLGSATTVVWNPGPEKAARLGDVPAGEDRKFLCVETANVRDAAITLAPGETHRLRAEYRVESL